MRYCVVTYLKQPTDAGYNESITLHTKLKSKELNRASIILDFVDRKVVKARLQAGTSIPKDWDNIVGYYKENYTDIIQRLENENK